MFSIRSLILPSLDRNHRARFWSNLSPDVRATICVAQNVLAFESLKPKSLLSPDCNPLFQSIRPKALRFARKEK